MCIPSCSSKIGCSLCSQWTLVVTLCMISQHCMVQVHFHRGRVRCEVQGHCASCTYASCTNTWIDCSINLDAQQLVGCMRIPCHHNLQPHSASTMFVDSVTTFMKGTSCVNSQKQALCVILHVKTCSSSVAPQDVCSHACCCPTAVLQAKGSYSGDNALGDAKRVSTQGVAGN